MRLDWLTKITKKKNEIDDDQNETQYKFGDHCD